MPYDERFYVGDGEKDGQDPVMDWKSSSGRMGRLVGDGLGFGNWGWRNKDFAESTTITFRACVLYEPNGWVERCGPWRTVSAGAN